MEFFDSTKKRKSRSSSRSRSRSSSSSSSSSKSRSRRSRRSMSELTPEDILVKVPSPTKTEEIELKFQDPLPNVITYDEKIAQKMEKTFKLHNKLEPFAGNLLFENIFYLYLFNKYKMNCIITDVTLSRIGVKIFISDKPEILDELTRQKNKLTIDLFNCIKSGSEIVIIPVSLGIRISGREGSHANLLIYRKNTNELEHFEPHGERYLGNNFSVINQKLNYFLETALAQVNFKIKKDNIPMRPIVFVKANSVCPRRHGVQTLEGHSKLPKNIKEPIGYCAAWSMFFTELCLKNPEIPSRQIYEAIFKKGDLYRNQNDYYKSVIRGYTCFINNKISKYFSEVLEEPITSKLIAKQYKNIKEGKSSFEINFYFDAISKIIEVELGLDPDTIGKFGDQDTELVRNNYSRLKNTIKNRTSSSDDIIFKSKVRSPKRVHSI